MLNSSNSACSKLVADGQIISVNASIFSSLQSSSQVSGSSAKFKRIDDPLTRISAPHEAGEPRVVGSFCRPRDSTVKQLNAEGH